MIEILARTTTKTQEQLVIKHSDKLKLNPAYTFFLRQMADLMDNGHAGKITSWDDDECGIIWGEIQDKVVGIFAYNRQNTGKGILEILLTAVDKNHRRKGIHTILNQQFEQVASSMNCDITAATISPNNKVRLVTAEKDGYKLMFYKMYKVIA
jgi:GNAT superfamily N-acetyltransferase